MERLLDLLASSATPAALQAVLGTATDDAVWRALRRVLDTVEAQAAGRFKLAFDATLVRGMGYYTGPIFEIEHGDSTSSIAGGGRYDRMIGRFIGRDVPATGFSIGFERVIGILMERGPSAEAPAERIVLVFDEAMPSLAPVLSLARDLRDQGRHVLLEAKSKRLGKQLQDLEARGFRRIGVVGADGAIEWRAPRSAASGETTA